MKFFQQLWSDESGQDIAEYAVMLAVILVIVVLGAVVAVARFGRPYAVAAMSPVLTQLKRLVRTVTQG